MTKSTSLCIILLIMGILYALMFIFTPAQFDDLLFEWYFTGSDSLADYILLVRQEENGRLPNIICGPWVHYLPAIAGDLLLTIATVAMIAAMGYLPWRWIKDTFSKANHTVGITLATSVAMAWTLAGVLLPWRQGLFVTDMTLNYIPVSLLALIIISLFLRPDKSLSTTTLGFVAGLLFGLMHEGATLTLLAGIGGLFLIKKGRLSRNQWIIVSGILIGGIVILSSPGIWLKLGATPDKAISIKDIVKAIPASILLLCTTIYCLLYCLISSKLRPTIGKLFRSELFVIGIFATIAGILLCYRTQFVYSRSGWFGELLAIICLMMEIQSIFSLRWQKVISIAGALAMSAIMTFAIKIQYTNYRIDKEIEHLFKESSTGTVFYDYSPRNSWLALRYPQSDVWIEVTQIAIRHIIGRTISVVPAALVDYSDCKAEIVEPGLYRYKGMLILEDYELTMEGGQGEEIAGVPAMKVELDLPAGDADSTLAPPRLSPSNSPAPRAPYLLQRFTTNNGEERIYVRPLPQ